MDYQLIPILKNFYAWLALTRRAVYMRLQIANGQYLKCLSHLHTPKPLASYQAVLPLLLVKIALL